VAEITSPREGSKLGIQVVHQEQKPTNEASIAEHFPDRVFSVGRMAVGWSHVAQLRR
jgi:ABC-type sugar transport system ATPase subunit